jgi:pilus assembly protein CpaB
MNLQRLLILGLAALAAGAAALLVRGLMGGGTPKVQAALPPTVSMSQVLVAASDLQPGQHLSGSQVHWQAWPKQSVNGTFLTQENTPNPEAALNGTVVRTPIVAGEPITNAKVIHSDAAGVMAANLTPGMRAVAITVSTDTGAGGFILPNDRVDLLATVEVSETPKRYRSAIILQNLRVLAMDQTFKEDKEQKVVIAKTATLEVTPEQAELISLAGANGTLSLALRSLADSSASALAQSALGPSAGASSGAVSVIRYGVGHGGGGGESKGQ